MILFRFYVVCDKFFLIEVDEFLCNFRVDVILFFIFWYIWGFICFNDDFYWLIGNLLFLDFVYDMYEKYGIIGDE